MRFSTTAAAATALSAGLVSATPIIVRRQEDSAGACSNITDAYTEFASNNETGLFIVDGQLAYDCLNSMPFDAEKASGFVAEMTKYLQFQSTIPQLLNPPDTYFSPGVDLLGGIDAIAQKANSSGYSSQYEFDTDIINLLSSANDGHLSAQLCSLGVFTFRQPYAIVSVSDDGTALPLLYTYLDGQLLANDTTANVSDITQINGQNATEYLLKLGLTQSNQDPDAQWNDLFFNQARAISGQGDSGSFFTNQGLWPNTSNITLTFSNGSDAEVRVQAVANGAFNFTTGDSLFEYYCLPANATSPSANSTAPSQPSNSPTATSGPVGYPEPQARDPYNFITGYYLDDEDLSDVAVLFIPSFETAGDSIPDSEEPTFASVASSFINAAVSDNKTKLVIDVSGNPGGTITSGFDLFKLFFPNMSAYSATRMRDHESQQLIFQAFSNLSLEENPDLYVQNSFNYADAVTPDQSSNFSSWEALYGPDNIQGGNMTNVYANFNFTEVSSDSQPIRGYGGVPLNETGQPFDPANIVIVSDGFCQSTCTTFVNLMTSSQFGGVKSIAFGGRPINSTMQAIGGTRGAQSADWSYLASLGQSAIQAAQNSTNTTTPVLTEDEITRLTEIGPAPLENWPLVIAGGNLNLRNSYDPNDLDTPLQFTYQPADCKLFYTAENIFTPATTWSAAARAIWGNGTCVDGSVPANSTTNSTDTNGPTRKLLF